MSELGEVTSILLDNKSDGLLFKLNLLDGDLAFVSKILQHLSATRWRGSSVWFWSRIKCATVLTLLSSRCPTFIYFVMQLDTQADMLLIVSKNWQLLNGSERSLIALLLRTAVLVNAGRETGITLKTLIPNLIIIVATQLCSEIESCFVYLQWVVYWHCIRCPAGSRRVFSAVWIITG